MLPNLVESLFARIFAVLFVVTNNTKKTNNTKNNKKAGGKKGGSFVVLCSCELLFNVVAFECFFLGVGVGDIGGIE